MTLLSPSARETAIAAERGKLEQMLDDLADNLEKTASNDPVKLSTTRFDVRRERTRSTEAPETPQNVRLRPTGHSGEVQVLNAASARAKGYEIQTASDPNAGPWTTYDTFSSVRGMILKGFPRAKDLWIRVRALGPKQHQESLERSRHHPGGVVSS